MNNQLSGRQMLLWSLAAVSAPLAIYAGDSSWEWTLIVGILCTCVVIVTLKLGEANRSLILRLVQLAGLAVEAGTFAKDISACWGQDGMVMPLTLIVLAALSAEGGAERAGRVSCTIAWIVAILYVIVLAAGTKNLDIHRINPDGKGNRMLIPTFLVPALFVTLPYRKGKVKYWLLVDALFAAVISLWCAGTGCGEPTSSISVPIYEYSRSLNLLGVAERFEAVTSVALTLGMFCLLSMLLCAAETLMNNGAILAGVGAAIVTALAPGNAAGLTIITLICWVGIPIFTGIKNNRKNMKKVLDKNEPR